MLENEYKTKLAKKIKEDLPGSIVCHLNPNEHQGIPDLLILNGDRWATLEGKKDAKSSHRPNQDYYVEKMNEMSFSSFIYPENQEEVLNELYKALQPRRKTRTTRSK